MSSTDDEGTGRAGGKQVECMHCNSARDKTMLPLSKGRALDYTCPGKHTCYFHSSHDIMNCFFLCDLKVYPASEVQAVRRRDAEGLW